jgi:RNA polymerase sigma factor (sigma-70 family)
MPYKNAPDELIENQNREIGEITEILTKWNEAKVEALDEVFPKVYGNLKNLAKKARKTIGRTDPDDTYNTLGLVNEIYLKLRKDNSVGFISRRRFYAYCLLMMGNLLRDYYFKKFSKQRETRLLDNLQTNQGDLDSEIDNLINLSAFSDYENEYSSIELAILFDIVLKKLEKKYPIEVEVIFLKYWLDKTDKEIADELNIKQNKVKDFERRGRISIRRMLDSNIDPIIRQASDITGTTLRNNYLAEVCGKDKDLLKDLEIILKERLKSQ